MKLFGSILDFLFPPRDHEALVNRATTEALGRHARPKVHDGNIVSLLPYRAPLVKACVLEAKFRESEKAQRLLGSVLADYLLELSADHPMVLVPIPLSRERLKDRGYNQAERIARNAAGRIPGIRIDASLLSRTRDTLPQTSLGGRARKQNMQGAFSAGTPDPLHTYIVFDDVLTTGSTLQAAVQALKESGATNIAAIALAH